ncbi:C-GCAxxG-C-C family protein [Maribellus maritimus]|uniref:C-GCAxxG-C-C family protein n=1 Tax=Maribellus maritimus TaxID=2870838 RepID=UPI001EEC571A|nr:C-GCAxxG-C-C family protein [Maribellus maritimus]MCG6188729.1 C-GCAxxG-C-C family protein [Maribellus maritimus]
MTKKADLVSGLYPKFNCAQATFVLFAPELELDEKVALKIASGFGGGMACAETCGAVTGSYMVIGMKHGYTSSDPTDKAITKSKIIRFNELFRKKHGSLTCKVLTGFDISTPEGANAALEAEVFQKKCPEFIKTACTILEEHF